MKIDSLFKELKTSFIFWYYDHYEINCDPYATYGKKTERFIHLHMLVTGKKLEQQFIHFLYNLSDYQKKYDILAHYPYSIYECIQNEEKIEK